MGKGRPKKDSTQMNISIPSSWKAELDNLARITSVEEGRTITTAEMIRNAVREKFQLDRIGDDIDDGE